MQMDTPVAHSGSQQKTHGSADAERNGANHALSTEAEHLLNGKHHSFADKLKREISMVAEGTVDGIADAARDAWSHKEMSALKVGTSALLGAGTAVAMTGLGLPAIAITAAGAVLAASSGKEMFKNGREVFGAMKDCWNNPEHCDANKEVVKKNVGPLVVDAALTTAGGAAGGALGRTLPVYFKETRLMNLLGKHHPETAEHSMRVAQYSKLTTQELGLPRGVQKEAYHAGKMHDVGKLKVPQDVLNKPSELNDVEFAKVKEHPGSSESILQGIPYGGKLKNVAKDAGSHHERVDGKGYPNHLKGDEISPVAKTLAPADVFDALTAGRAYARDGRAAFERMPLEQVKKTMDAKAGTQFDRQSLDALWNVPGNRMIGVLESSDRRPHVAPDVLRQFEGVRFGRLLDVLGGAPGSAKEQHLAKLLNQLYLAK